MTVSTRAGVTIVWSVVVWTALWGDLSVANVLAGLLVGIATLRLVPIESSGPVLPFRPVAATGLLLWFVWSLVKASAIVAWEVVTPRNKINQGIVAAPLQNPSRGLATLIANMISLTPGTLTLEIAGDPPVLYVHVLHLREFDLVRDDIAQLEHLVTRAFGPSPRPSSTEEQSP